YLDKSGFTNTNKTLTDVIVLIFFYTFPAGLVAMFWGMLFTSPDVTSTFRTQGSLGSDRRITIMKFIGYLVVIGLTFGFLFKFWGKDTLSDALSGGSSLGLLGGLAFGLIGSAWVRWFVLVRLWLPTFRRLPWRMMGFLDDAHERGVLRQVGAVYQFRHARLQDYLANQPRQRREGGRDTQSSKP